MYARSLYSLVSLVSFLKEIFLLYTKTDFPLRPHGLPPPRF
jgi:hypothetical protein